MTWAHAQRKWVYTSMSCAAVSSKKVGRWVTIARVVAPHVHGGRVRRVTWQRVGRTASGRNWCAPTCHTSGARRASRGSDRARRAGAPGRHASALVDGSRCRTRRGHGTPCTAYTRPGSPAGSRTSTRWASASRSTSIAWLHPISARLFPTSRCRVARISFARVRPQLGRRLGRSSSRPVRRSLPTARLARRSGAALLVGRSGLALPRSGALRHAAELGFTFDERVEHGSLLVEEDLTELELALKRSLTEVLQRDAALFENGAQPLPQRSRNPERDLDQLVGVLLSGRASWRSVLSCHAAERSAPATLTTASAEDARFRSLHVCARRLVISVATDTICMPVLPSKVGAILRK